MSVAEREIRDIPRPVIQPSVQYFDTKRVGRETKRWVFFAGDLIVPRRKQEIDWLRPGGEETNSGCLQKYGRGFIPRGLASLMEMGADLMPEEQLRNLGGEAWSGMSLNDELIKSRLAYVPIFPGDGLNNLLNRAQNDEAGKKGIVELTYLAGKEWEECHNPQGTGILDLAERAIYGDNLIVPPTLKGLETQIRQANIPTDLKEGKLQSCHEFGLWASVRIGIEHTLLRQGTHKEGHVYAYSPLGELLLVQLDIQRQDQPFAELAKLNKDIGEAVKVAIEGKPNGISLEDMQMMKSLFEDSIDSKLAAARKADQERIAELEAKLAAKESPAEYDINGERPAHIHWKQWQKMRKDAGLE